MFTVAVVSYILSFEANPIQTQRRTTAQQQKWFKLKADIVPLFMLTVFICNNIYHIGVLYSVRLLDFISLRCLYITVLGFYSGLLPGFGKVI